ncbi:MAG: FAD-dependent oxidoreductase [Promethearchaeota archaeon]
MRGSVLVIGAGIAGIEVSLNLTDLGFKVYLIEKNPSIGGHMAQLEKTFPNYDCSLCILAPKMVELYRNPNVELYTLSQVKKVSGNSGKFKITIEKQPRFVDENKCRGCGDCATKCPKIESPNLFDMNLSKRKSIFIPFPQATPPVYLIDPNLCLYLNRKICGVCQKVCKAEAINFFDEPREFILEVGAIIVATGFRMLGKELSLKWGYKYKNVVNTLEFERILSKSGPFGGKLLRLSDEKQPQKIAFIQCAGSFNLEDNLNYCSRICCLYTLKEAVLTKQYSSDIEVLIFRHKLRAFGKRFYNYAKHGQEQYKVHYIQSKIYSIKENPQTNDLIIKYKNLKKGTILEDTANMVVLAAPMRPSKYSKVLAKLLKINIDKNGFFKERSYFQKSLSSRKGIYLCGSCQSPMNITETVIDANSVASQVASFLYPVKFTDRVVEQIENSSSNEKIKINPSVLIIGGGISGMTAALRIASQGFTAYILERQGQLGGNLKDIYIIYPTGEKASIFLENIKEKIESNDNIITFTNVEIIDLQGDIGNYEVTFRNNNGKNETIVVGTIILATGGREFKPEGYFQYKKENSNIITQMDLEKRLTLEGKNALEQINRVAIILCVAARQKSGFRYCSNICCNNAIKYINLLETLKPTLNISVLFRDFHLAKRDFEEFFTNEKKNASFIRYSLKNLPEIIKIDKNREQYLIRMKDDSNEENNFELMAEMVILISPMVPATGLEKLANILKVPLDEYGFFSEAHVKLRPLDFINNGIFMCGCAQWPKNIQDSISQANSAAGRASRFLNMKEISRSKLRFLSFLLSIECYFKDMIVNHEKCNGCGNCLDVCAFKAIKLIEIERDFEDIKLKLKKAVINPAICKGCGKCASTCRLKAIDARHFDFKQISSIIDPFFIGQSSYRKKDEEILLIP